MSAESDQPGAVRLADEDGKRPRPARLELGHEVARLAADVDDAAERDAVAADMEAVSAPWPE